jgi:hypothetical protein
MTYRLDSDGQGKQLSPPLQPLGINDGARLAPQSIFLVGPEIMIQETQLSFCGVWPSLSRSLGSLGVNASLLPVEPCHYSRHSS